MDIVFDEIKLGYSEDQPLVLEGLTLEIPSGQRVALLGRSGCGKTTLMKLAAGLLPPTYGRVQIQGQSPMKQRDQVGVVFQAPALLEWLTVLDNVLLPRALHEAITQADRERAMALLKRLGIDSLAARYPEQLSGGQMSRVAMARSLLQDPAVLLLDEPFAALDAMTREALQEELLQIAKRRSMTMLFITHDIAEAVYVSDRVVVMDQGKIVADEVVPFSDNRHFARRYEADFNDLCLLLRSQLERGAEEHGTATSSFPFRC